MKAQTAIAFTLGFILSPILIYANRKKMQQIEIEAFHPGVYLKEEIEHRGLVKKNVAEALEILPNHLSDIFAGKRNISPVTAILLEQLLGISADYWLSLQRSYDLQTAREIVKEQKL